MELDWFKGPTEEGWMEYADNQGLMRIFEEVYKVKEAFKALVENKEMMEENERLGMLALQEPHFQKMWSYVQADLHVQGLEELGKRLCSSLKELKTLAD